MLTKLEQLTSEVLDKNPFWQYKCDDYRLPNGAVGKYYYAWTRGSVFIIARFDDGRIVLMNQFRYLNQKESIEFPGGGIAENMETQEQAQCELREEAGIEAGSWIYLGGFNPLNGLTNEVCHVYLAENLVEVGARPEESEEFERVLWTENEIASSISSGRIWDGMTLAAWTLYTSKRS